MTAWNELVGALIVKGYSERRALHMVYDLLHEEAQRIKDLEPPKTLDPTGRAWLAWKEAVATAAASLDPDDPDWQARCTHCYKSWHKDHVCHMAWYDWTRTNKNVLVDSLAYAVALIDSRMWKTRTPNEDDPMWVQYKTYGQSGWEQLLEVIRLNAKREDAAPTGDQLPVDEACETRDARTCTTSCTVHGEPEDAPFEPECRWILQGRKNDGEWVTHKTEEEEGAAQFWLDMKRSQVPDHAWRTVKENRTYQVEDM